MPIHIEDIVFRRSARSWSLVAVTLSLSLWGCALNYESTKSGRSPLEQLLMTQSLQRSLADAAPPVRSGQSIAVEAVGLTADQPFMISQIEKWLAGEGLTVPKDGKEGLVARVTIEAFGTLQDGSFFGIPPVSGGLFPISLPELALYKATRQRAMTRFSVDFIDKKNGRLIRSTPVHEGYAFYNQYVLFFAFNFNTTDLIPPP